MRPASEAGGTAPPPRRPAWLTPAVLALGGISLLTDVASEMIYPLLPVFLSRVLGAQALAVGLVEGVAEAVSSTLKVLSGGLSDATGCRRRFVVAGYSVSALARPLMALAGAWPHVVLFRAVDRVGKGIRSAPRDAILSASATPGTRGRVFGFHRAMDHVGAVLGPLLAAVFLWWAPGQYRTLFALTALPGLGVLWLLRRVPRDECRPGCRQPDPGTRREMSAAGGERVAGDPLALPGTRERLSPAFWRTLTILLLFALGNSTDAFLLLRLSNAGVAVAAIPLLWALLHVVKAVSSVLGGRVADHVERPRLIASGWLLYAAIYAGFAGAGSPGTLIALFLTYGVYYGLTEGTEKALVADLAPAAQRGLAFGWYHGALGAGALLSSVVFGLVWQAFGAASAFALGAVLAVCAAALMLAAGPTVDDRQTSRP